MAQTGRAAVFDGLPRGSFAIREYPVPKPAPGTVLLRIEYCGVCGTDVHHYRQGTGSPVLLGHEIVGTIEALGEGVETDYVGNPVKVGDRVVPTPGGVFSDPDGPQVFNGGYCEYWYMPQPGSAFFKMDMSPEAAVLLEPMGVALRGIDTSKIRLGDTVVVQGTGAIGLLCIVCARLSGATRIVAVGAPAGRLELARELGADVAISIDELRSEEDRVKAVLAETPGGLGADVVVECVGRSSAFVEGLGYMKRGGTFCELGHFVDVGTYPINLNQHILRKGVTLVTGFGGGGGNLESWARSARVLAKEQARLGGLVTHRVPLSRLRDVLEAQLQSYHLDGRDIVKAAVVPD